MTRHGGAAIVVAVALGAGCGGGSSGSGEGVTFHGEQQALAGYSYDTGYQPSTPPVQVRLVLSSAGALTADAKATGSGDSITPTAGSGLFVMDAHLKIQALVKIDVAGVGKLEGAIPGAPDIDLAFGGQMAFEPFLLGGGKASVTADVPETQLAEIPLGTIPGNLVIKAVGTITSEFAGVCAEAKGGVGQYTGTTSTGGTITLRPSVVLDIPVVGSKTYDVPEIPVTIAPTAAAMDLGTKSLEDGSDAAGPGPCGTIREDGGVAGDGGGQQDGGGGSCTLSCPGCCQGNTCQAGTEASACGSAGHECASCHGQTPYCVGGVCTAGSSCAATCPGCCSGETCYGGTIPGACGSNGGPCRQCGVNDDCVSGQCRGTGNCASTCAGCCSGETCYDGTITGACGRNGTTCLACPSHFVCGATRKCELDPTSLWDVYAVDAQLPAHDPSGAAWDPFSGLPDGYVTINTYVGGASHLSGKSSTKDDTLTPVWNERVLSGVMATEILTGGLGFALYDEDPTSFDDYIDSCSGYVPEGDFDGQPHPACSGLIPLRYKILPH